MSVRKSKTENSPGHWHRNWQKSYSVTVEVDVAKILGVLALFALIALFVANGSGHELSPASALHGIWRLLLPVSEAAASHQSPIG